MSSDALISDTLVIIGALAIFVERVAERFINTVMPDKDPAEPDWSRWKKWAKLTLVTLFALAVASAIVWPLNLRLMADIFPSADLTATQDRVVTLLLIGGGSAPAHEILRYIENKKNKAEKESKA